MFILFYYAAGFMHTVAVVLMPGLIQQQALVLRLQNPCVISQPFALYYPFIFNLRPARHFG